MSIDTFASQETLVPLAQLKEHGVDLSHFFVGKGYTKVYHVPAGKVIVQHKHKMEHQSVLILGVAKLILGGVTRYLRAPAVVNIEAHKVHGIEAVTDILWACVWPDVQGFTDPNDVDHQVVA